MFLNNINLSISLTLSLNSVSIFYVRTGENVWLPELGSQEAACTGHGFQGLKQISRAASARHHLCSPCSHAFKNQGVGWGGGSTVKLLRLTSWVLLGRRDPVPESYSLTLKLYYGPCVPRIINRQTRTNGSYCHNPLFRWRKNKLFAHSLGLPEHRGLV